MIEVLQPELNVKGGLTLLMTELKVAQTLQARQPVEQLDGKPGRGTITSPTPGNTYLNHLLAPLIGTHEQRNPVAQTGPLTLVLYTGPTRYDRRDATPDPSRSEQSLSATEHRFDAAATAEALLPATCRLPPTPARFLLKDGTGTPDLCPLIGSPPS